MSAQEHFTPPVFVISLERSSDRRHSMATQFDRTSIDFEFFPATNGEKLTQHELAQYDEQFVIERISRPMSRAEVGCYLSHARLWKKIVDEGIPWAVILEDDVDLMCDVDGLLSAVGALPFGWELIRLAGLGLAPALPLFPLPGETTLATLLQGAGGTQGYCISLRGAKKLLDFATPRVVGTVDDHVIDNCWKTGLRILAVLPYPISENKGFVSSIETERRSLFQEYRKKPEKMAFRQWTNRRRHKLGRSIGRRMYAVVHTLFWLRHQAQRIFTHRGDGNCATATVWTRNKNKA
jgi:glycosyl transferase, family 25